MIQLTCSGCGCKLRTPDELAGKKTKCPRCGAILRIPTAGPASGMQAETLPHSPAPTGPVTVPGYEVLGELGRGGMGVIYKARQLQPPRLVALKMILAGEHAGAEVLARFKSEAETVARLVHPNIVQIYQVGEHQGRPFLTLELIEGGTLAQRLGGKPLPPRLVARLLHQLAQAVEFALRRGIVHRDLKSANILLARNEEDEADTLGIPKIVDFGLAKQLEGVVSVAAGPHTQSGAILGTPAYMAPEQADGRSKEVGPAADVYALGAVLYECLTGRPPFQADSMIDLLLQVATAEPASPRQLRRGCPRDLETICLKCLEKDPKRRFSRAGELAAELDRYLHDRPITCRPPGPRERLGRMLRRHRNLAYLLAGALAAVCISGALLVLWYPRRQATSSTAGTAATTGVEKVEEPLQPLPADLHLVPRDAFSFTTVRLADLLARRDVRNLYEASRLWEAWGMGADGTGLWGLAQESGIKAAGVERLTFLSSSATEPEMVFLLALSQPLEPDRLREAARKAVLVRRKNRPAKQPGLPRPETAALEPIVVQGKTVYRPGEPGIPEFCAYGDRTLLVGSVEGLTRLLERSAWSPDRGPLRKTLSQAAGTSALVMGVHPPPQFFNEIPILSATQRLLLRKLEGATLVLDLPAASGPGPLTGFSADLRLDFLDEAAAVQGRGVAQAMLKEMLGQMSKPGNVPAELHELAASLVKPLQTASWQQEGKRVSLAVRFGWSARDVAHWQTTVQEFQSRDRSMQNLLRIGTALMQYHTRNGRFPPAAIHGKDGKPLYSWRVILLPYLGQQALYKEFRLEEAWDSEHNKKLLEKMPAVYACPGPPKKRSPGKTHYQVFVGPRAAFEGREGLRMIDFTDGTANTLLAAEAAEAVPWTAPQDLRYEPGKPLPKVGGVFKGGFNALFASGGSRFLPADLPAGTLEAYITRNGGEGVGILGAPQLLPEGARIGKESAGQKK